LKLYTVKIHHSANNIKEEIIPSDSFELIGQLYSIFGIKVELIKEEDYIEPIKSKRKKKK